MNIVIILCLLVLSGVCLVDAFFTHTGKNRRIRPVNNDQDAPRTGANAPGHTL